MNRTTAEEVESFFLALVAVVFGLAGLGGWLARASYGRANLGVAISLGWAAGGCERYVSGLVGGVAVGFAMGFARTTEIVLDGTREAIQWALLAMELGDVVFGVLPWSALAGDSGSSDEAQSTAGMGQPAHGVRGRHSYHGSVAWDRVLQLDHSGDRFSRSSAVRETARTRGGYSQ